MVTIQCQKARFADIQAIVFDKDGTLANSELFLRNLAQRRSRLIDARIPGVQEPLLMAFGVDQMRVNPAGLMAVGTRHDNAIAAAAYVAETGRDWLEALNIVHHAFEEADRYSPSKADETPPFPGVVDTLAALSQQVKLGLLSSDSTANVQDFTKRYDLSAYFALQMGTDGNLGKPDPAFLEQACHALRVPVHQTLVVGDSLADLKLAESAGAAGFIGVTGGWSQSIALPGATVLIDRLDALQVQE